MNILYSALTETNFVKIKYCSNVKIIWDTLESIYVTNDFFELKSVDSSLNLELQED